MPPVLGGSTERGDNEDYRVATKGYDDAASQEALFEWDEENDRLVSRPIMKNIYQSYTTSGSGSGRTYTPQYTTLSNPITHLQISGRLQTEVPYGEATAPPDAGTVLRARRIVPDDGETATEHAEDTARGLSLSRHISHFGRGYSVVTNTVNNKVVHYFSNNPLIKFLTIPNGEIWDVYSNTYFSANTSSRNTGIQWEFGAMDIRQLNEEDITNMTNGWARSVVVFNRVADDVTDANIENLSGYTGGILTEGEEIVREIKSITNDLYESGYYARWRVHFDNVALPAGRWMMSIVRQGAYVVSTISGESTSARNARLAGATTWLQQNIFHTDFGTNSLSNNEQYDAFIQANKSTLLSPTTKFYTFPQVQSFNFSSLSHPYADNNDYLTRGVYATGNRVGSVSLSTLSSPTAGSSPIIYLTPLDVRVRRTRIPTDGYRPTFYADVPAIKDNSTAREFAKNRLDFFLNNRKRDISFSAIDDVDKYDVGTVTRFTDDDDPVIVTGKEYRYRRGYVETDYNCENKYSFNRDDITVDILDKVKETEETTKEVSIRTETALSLSEQALARPQGSTTIIRRRGSIALGRKTKAPDFYDRGLGDTIGSSFREDVPPSQ